MSNEFMFRRIILKDIFDTFLDYPYSQGRMDSDIFFIDKGHNSSIPRRWRCSSQICQRPWKEDGNRLFDFNSFV